MEISDIVESVAGHDKGGAFLIVGVDSQFVYLADGKLRKIERPKRKKRIHVRYLFGCEHIAAKKLRNGDKVLNSEIRRAINEYLTSAGAEPGRE